MSTAAVLVATLAAVPGTANAQSGEQENIYGNWDMAGGQAWNLDVNMTVKNVSDDKFFAQTFDFDTGGGGYFGLQQKANGQRVAIFSMWRDGLNGQARVFETGHSNCQPDPGAENGGGIQCFLSYNWSVDAKYTLRVWRLEDNGTTDRWGAWIIDSAGNQQQIGTILVTTPRNQRSDITGTRTFLEDFADIGDCVSPIYTRLILNSPTINAGRATLPFTGDNGGSACGNGSSLHVGSNINLYLGSGPIKLVGVGGNCLDVNNAGTGNGTIVKTWGCNGHAAQQWRLTTNGEIRGIGNNCLDVRGPSTANGTQIQMWDCVGVANQKWTLMPNGEIRGYGNKCLDVSGANPSPGAKVQLWTCNGTPAQRWARQL